MPNIEQMPMEDRWYYTITRDKFDFVCSMFIHDLLMHPIYNTFLVLFLIFGCWHAIAIGDMVRLISYIGIVLFVKIRSIVLIAKLYNAYQKGICHSFDVDGVNVVVDVCNEGTDYKHFTSLLWEQIRRIVVYGDFMVIDVDRQYRDKVQFEMAIIFTKDIERVSNQASISGREPSTPSPKRESTSMQAMRLMRSYITSKTDLVRSKAYFPSRNRIFV